MSEKLLLTTKEACELLNISDKRLRQLVKKGEIPVQKWGHKILVRRVALERMLEETKPEGK